MLKRLIRYFDLRSDSELVRPTTILWLSKQNVSRPEAKRQETVRKAKRASQTLENKEIDACGKTGSTQDGEVINAEYFDVEAQDKPDEQFSFHRLHKSAWGQWTALFAGILVQPFFQAYQTTHRWAWDGFSGWSLFALITSVIVFPAVYRNTFDEGKPVVIQLAPIFAAGLGWQSLISTAIKAATNH